MLVGWQIYNHGFCVRLRVEDGARGKTLEALRRHLGFGKRTRWSRRGERDCLRGSGWLTARRPGPKTCIGKLNRGRKLALYNLAVADRDDGLFIDIQGVRKGDQKRVMEGILGLEASDWSIEYYRRLERYVVLSLRPGANVRRAQAGSGRPGAISRTLGSVLWEHPIGRTPHEPSDFYAFFNRAHCRLANSELWHGCCPRGGLGCEWLLGIDR